MDHGVHLRERELAAATGSLLQARDVLARVRVRPHTLMPSLGAIGERVEAFVRGVEIARGSLADAELSASRLVAVLMCASDDLDHELAARLGAHFVLRDTDAGAGQ